MAGHWRTICCLAHTASYPAHSVSRRSHRLLPFSCHPCTIMTTRNPQHCSNRRSGHRATKRTLDAKNPGKVRIELCSFLSRIASLAHLLECCALHFGFNGSRLGARYIAQRACEARLQSVKVRYLCTKLAQTQPRLRGLLARKREHAVTSLWASIVQSEIGQRKPASRSRKSRARSA